MFVITQLILTSRWRGRGWARWRRSGSWWWSLRGTGGTPPTAGKTEMCHHRNPFWVRQNCSTPNTRHRFVSSVSLNGSISLQGSFFPWLQEIRNSFLEENLSKQKFQFKACQSHLQNEPIYLGHLQKQNQNYDCVKVFFTLYHHYQ